MTSYICTDSVDGHIRVCCLSSKRGVTGFSEHIGRYTTQSGQVFEFRRLPSGPASYLNFDDTEHVQQQIREIVENIFWAKCDPTINVEQPLVLSDGKTYAANRVDALLRVTLKSLAECPDFKAHISLLSALYQFLRIQSDIANLCDVASAMTIEKGMYLPVTDVLGNTSVMVVRSRSKEEGCYNVSFYSDIECPEPMCTGYPIVRVAVWKERGSNKVQSAKSLIGEIV